MAITKEEAEYQKSKFILENENARMENGQVLTEEQVSIPKEHVERYFKEKGEDEELKKYFDRKHIERAEEQKEDYKDVSVEEFLKYKTITKGERRGEVVFDSVDIDKVAEYIENKFAIRTIFGVREETIEVYKEGIWTEKGRGIIKAEIERLLGIYSKNNVVAEVLEKIKRRTEIEREDADNVPDYKRCVKNGVLDFEDIDNIKFLAHSKEYNFRSKFPMNYNPTATCPKIEKFVKQTFYDEDIFKVQEWQGLHLVKRYAHKKAAIFHGPRNTGKTVWLNLLTSFLGGNVSGLSLQEISRGKPFDLLALKDKDGNICDDLQSEDMKSVGGFKMAVGDGYISAEMKFGDKCRFRNTAKDTNACNKIPSPGEDIDDEAYYERILLIPVDNVVSKEEMNNKLIDELTTHEELSGLLNWAIEGYVRLVKQNSFSNDKTPEETKFLMLKNGISLAEFASDVLIQKDGAKIDKETMYQIYCFWCGNHKPKLSPDSKDKIGKTLTKFASYTQASSNGKERYWLNVKINDSYYTLLKHTRFISGSNKEYNNDRYVISKDVIPVSKKVIEDNQKGVIPVSKKEPKEQKEDIDFNELKLEDADE